MNEKSDKQLVLAIRDGDILSYEELVKRYQHGLYVFVFRIVHDEAVSHDVTGEALFKVYETIDRIDITKKFSTYVFEIAKNLAISYLRSHKKHISIEEVAYVEDEESFLEEFYRWDRAEVVHAAVARLESKYKNVITLYYFEDLSYEEVGKKLRIPTNTVRTHLARAKEKLKKLIPYEER
jgi:RNA polymerase sigma factor (sigma-70 family)